MREVSVVLAYCDNEEKTNVLSQCIDVLLSMNQDIILVSHSEIPYEIYSKCKVFHYSSDNGVLYYDDFKKYNLTFSLWEEKDNIRLTRTGTLAHSYAVWQLVRCGTHLSNQLGYDIIHFINYDCVLDGTNFLNKHTSLLLDRNFVFYSFEEPHQNETNSFITFLFSSRVEAAKKIFSYFENIDEYFYYGDSSHVMECRIADIVKKENFSYYVFKKSLLKNLTKNVDIINLNAIETLSTELNIFTNKKNSQKYLVIYNKSAYTITSDFKTELNNNNRYKVIIDNIKEEIFDLVDSDKKILEISDFENIKLYKNEKLVFDGQPRIYPENEIEFKTTEDIKISYSFVDGANFQYNNLNNEKCFVEFINNDLIEYSVNLVHGHYAKTNKKFFVDWVIKYMIGNEIKNINVELKDKNVFIPFESNSLGDTIAWMPYVELFRLKHGCKIICSTFHNYLFEHQYPNITFMTPGNIAHNLYAMYRLGVFYDNNNYDENRHPSNPQHQPLGKIASDILGLDYVEIKPMLPKLGNKKEKRVCIAVHSTAQCKYWNNESGWQEVVDYLVSLGYEVRLLSHEEDGYMGNKNPINVVQQPRSSLLEVLKVLQESEFFIGISSGLSWLSWASGTPTVIISGFTDEYLEPQDGIYRVINKKVCHGCWHKHTFNTGDWNWCPEHKGTDRQFECSKTITSADVIEKIQPLLSKNEN